MTDRLPVSAHVEVMRGPDAGRYPYGNPVLVTGADRAVQIDSALGVDVAPVDDVLLSHYHEDHVAGLARQDASAGRRATWIHERDLPGVRSWEGFCDASGFAGATWLRMLEETFEYEPLPGTNGFGDDAMFDLGGGVRIGVVPLPGHTAGHCGFFVEPDRVLYLGDVDLSGFGPFYADASGSLTETLASLDRCAELDAAVYLTYHHKGPYADRPVFLDALATYRGAVDRHRDGVLGLLDRPRSPREMVGHGVVYRPGTMPPFGPDAEARMCERHLRALVATGEVDGPDERGRYRRVRR